MKKDYKKHYKMLIKNNKTYNCTRCSAKELLKNEPKLIITNNHSCIYELDNIQSLYLYPLTIIEESIPVSVKVQAETLFSP